MGLIVGMVVGKVGLCDMIGANEGVFDGRLLITHLPQEDVGEYTRVPVVGL